jgi:hypothetical protein
MRLVRETKAPTKVIIACREPEFGIVPKQSQIEPKSKGFVIVSSRVEPVREVVAVAEPGPVFRIEYCDVRFWYPWHFHSEIEIKHVVRGSGTRRIGDSVESFTDGDLCIVGSGTPHSWSSKAERGRWVRARVVQFHPGVFGAERGSSGLQLFLELLERSRRGIHVVALNATRVSRS